jgi:hypothetical protein
MYLNGTRDEMHLEPQAPTLVLVVVPVIGDLSLLVLIDCPRASPGPGGPGSGPDRTPKVRVQVQIWVGPGPK